MVFKESTIIMGRTDKPVILSKARDGMFCLGLFCSAGKVLHQAADDAAGAQSFFNGKTGRLFYVDGFIAAHQVHNALHPALSGSSLLFKHKIAQGFGMVWRPISPARANR